MHFNAVRDLALTVQRIETIEMNSRAGIGGEIVGNRSPSTGIYKPKRLNFASLSRDIGLFSRDIASLSRDIGLFSRDISPLSRDIDLFSRDIGSLSRDISSFSRNFALFIGSLLAKLSGKSPVCNVYKTKRPKDRRARNRPSKILSC